jgi:hypothetical protein
MGLKPPARESMIAAIAIEHDVVSVLNPWEK